MQNLDYIIQTRASSYLGEFNVAVTVFVDRAGA
jgi:hypothetical protein